MRSLTVSMALLLAACSTPQEHAARVQAEMEQNIAVYGPACARLGYPADSDQWRSCVLQLSTKDDLERYGNTPYYYGGFGAGHWRGGGFWGPW